MSAQRVSKYITPQEYLAWEHEAETKSEYDDGIIRAMVGASKPHTRIKSDIEGGLNNQLQGRACEAMSSDIKVRVPDCNAYFYPDVVVVCGNAQTSDASDDTLFDATIIVEVLSPSTERFDRRRKWECYKTLPSFQVYLLVAQDEPYIEMYTRQADNSWRIDTAVGLDAEIALPSIGCTLKLADVYRRVPFPPALNITDTSDDSAALDNSTAPGDSAAPDANDGPT